MALPLPGIPAKETESHTFSSCVYSYLEQNFISGILLILVIGLLYAVSRYNFALFHTAIEFSTIAVAAAIFLLVWKSRRIVQNNYLVFIGITFIFIAVLDFLHTTVYQGVGIFADGGGTLSTRLWIAARYMQAVTLLAAPLVIRKNVRMDLVAVIYLAADILIVASIFVFKDFPATYIEGVGLTPFKIFSEYIICAMLVGAVILLYRNRESFDRQVLNNLVIAIVLTTVSEITFTEYASFVDIFSVIGHVVRLIAYYFFYRAIIEVGQEKPYNLLYRDLNESEKKYRALSDLSPDIILVHRRGIILYLNRAGLQFFGVSNFEEIAGKNILDYIHPDDHAAGEVRITTIEDQQVTVPLTEVRYVVNGRTLPAEVTAGPTLWEGAPAVQAVIRDRTLRKLAEEALREAQIRTVTILEGIADTFYSLDDQWRFTVINPAAEKAPFGRPATELLGRVIWELYPDLVGTPIHRHYLDAAEKKTMEYYVAQSPLNERWYEVFMQGRKGGVDVYMRDITERKSAEEELRLRNEDLNAANEELTATQEELQLNLDELSRREHELSEALAEKEVLLAEVHHRVKNNLTAFISLLSLEGTYESTPEAQNLRKDLQNRARSMALIHETLYRTRKYSSVDMGLYLSTLIGQVTASYTSAKHIRTIVEAEGVVIDLARATPCGLIINELVTNSFKYAFPDTFDCSKERKEPCTIRISLTKEDDIYVLKAGDNGIGLPEGIDIMTTKSLGLKLVNFLARHQLRAKIEIVRRNGSEFIFRFPETIINSGGS